MRVLSGIQPSGYLHLGNYFGAMQQHIELQNEHECYFFLADLHALTSIQNRDDLYKYTMNAAADYLAMGLDPDKVVFFRQSDVPEVTELYWILSNITPMGLLERCHSYKDKISQGLSPHHGLFSYPVLMAADILLYNADVVPVGKDQKQHIEVTRDIAQKFNNIFGNILKIPNEMIREKTAIVPGIDGRKMSKSYGNTIKLFLPEDELKKRVFSIKTDSLPVDAPKDPSKCNLFALYKLFASKEKVRSMEERYKKGGLSYKEVKEELFEMIRSFFKEHEKERLALERNSSKVKTVLKNGAKKAREEAAKTIKKVRAAVGLEWR